MKLGLIGLPQSGRSTVLAALTGARGEQPDRTRAESRIATVNVYDQRLDFLARLYQAKKTTYTKIEYVLPVDISTSSAPRSESAIWNQLRVCDGLLHVLRNFPGPGGTAPGPEQDFRQLEEEMILADLAVAEKRMERIELDRQRGKKPPPEEPSLLQLCREMLSEGAPLRNNRELASNPALRGFTFLTAKPMLVIANNAEEDETLPEWERRPDNAVVLLVRGRLEMDIASMESEDALEFRQAYNIRESALDRVIESSHGLLNRIFFFTVSPEEVKAWSITTATPALEAAGTVHTDMQKGFIRAETVSFADLQACGSFQEAKKAGLIRLEGKEYEVQDGDIIQFRFNL